MAVLFCVHLFQQNVETYISARFGHLKMEGYTPRQYGGVELDFQFENYMGIQYSFLGGKNYYHMPLAPPIGFWAGLAATNSVPLTDTTIDRFGLGVFIGILTAIVPESVSYEIPFNYNFSVSPYISPLQLEFLKNKGNEKGDWSAGLGIGSRLHLYLNQGKLRVSPFFEYKIHYKNGIPKGYTFGLNIAARIKGR